MKVFYRMLIALGMLLLLSSCDKTRHYNTPNAAQFEVFLSQSRNRILFKQFRTYLKNQGVIDVVPTDQLLRQGTDWHDVKLPPFAMPPRKDWRNIIKTLKVIKADIIPLIGPVEVLSAFRTHRYNSSAGGSKGSKHLIFSGVDLLPKKQISRAELHNKLKRYWRKSGRPHAIGLGLYSGLRFHIDTARYRTW